MVIRIDTEKRTLATGDADYPLSSPEAFAILSREWLEAGWRLGHWTTFSWMGRQLVQFPDDALRLAEAVWLLAPDVVIETGVYEGGGTLLFAALCRLHGRGRVIGVERDVRPGVREALAEWGHGLVTLLEGDSAAPETAARVRGLVRPGETVFVFLDSDHAAAHVAAELLAYAPLVSPGSYIVVADSNTPGPAEAAAAFLAREPAFERARPRPLFTAECDFGELSYFPSTWLRRRAGGP